MIQLDSGKLIDEKVEITIGDVSYVGRCVTLELEPEIIPTQAIGGRGDMLETYRARVVLRFEVVKQ